MGSSTNANRVSAAHKAKVENLNAASEPAAKKAQNEKNKKTVQAASLLKPQDQIKRFAEMKQDIIDLVDNLANGMTSELTQLQTVVDATRLAREELEQTHGIIAEANSLSALVLSQDEIMKDFQEKMAVIRASCQQEEKDRDLNRKREDDAYRYNLSVTRRKENDEWETEKQIRLRDFETDLESRVLVIVEREKAVQLVQTELVELREKVQQAEARQDAEVKKQVAIATSSLKKDLENQAAIERLKLENQNALLSQQLVGLETKIKDLTQQNGVLNDKYLDATARVQTIAERAVDASSQRPNYFTAPIANGQESGKRN